MIELFFWSMAIGAWWYVGMAYKIMFWWPQKRWVVWLPENPTFWYMREKIWITPVDKITAEKYAKAFNGKVYRVR